MGHHMKSGLIRRKPLPGGIYLNKKGPMATMWDTFRGKKLERDKDEDGLITCQDWKIGLQRCGQRSTSPDLHHVEGREARPDLYFSDGNLVWLVRSCHDEAHDRNTNKSSSQASHDTARQVGAAPQRDALLAVQGSTSSFGARPTGRTVYSSVQSRNASVLEREKEGSL